ncbi:hypothetical protein L9F63_022862, partial [Diploptera punctata]
YLWHRLRARKGEGYEGVLQRDESSDPLAVKSLSASGNLLTDEVRTLPALLLFATKGANTQTSNL